MSNLPVPQAGLPAVQEEKGLTISGETKAVAEPVQEKPKEERTKTLLDGEKYLTIEETRRLVNRVRNTGFFLYVRGYLRKADDLTIATMRTTYLRVSAKQVFEFLEEMERQDRSNRERGQPSLLHVFHSEVGKYRGSIYIA